MDYFTHALQLAQQALGLSNPNPCVGCVVVSAQGQIMGRGHTQARGQAHAEVMALRDAARRGADVAGSTVYVTLEPCAHHGRTPPCCDALIAARVGKVVVALPDPNPHVAGQGMARLRAAGIAVEMADAAVAEAARDINIGFLHRMQHGLPWVRLKTAASLDGLTALPNGQSQWITGEAARADVQHWRARACAVLTGIGTVLHDDPLLNVRLPHAQRQPHLVVVDSHLRTPPHAQLFGVPNRQVWIYTIDAPADSAAEHRASALRQAGATLVALPATASGQVDLPGMLHDLAQREVNELHVEAGGTLNGALLQADAVDEWVAYAAPLLLGLGKPLAALPALPALADAPRWHVQSLRTVGSDVRMVLRKPCAALSDSLLAGA